jgi:hypothetical protein
VSQKPTGESCGARWAVTTPAESFGARHYGRCAAWASTRQSVLRHCPVRPDASFGLRTILPSEARLRDAWPQEDTSHDPRAPKAHAQLVPASEPR